jgi:hypothetical protein
MTKLLRDDKPFIWKEEQRQAFHKLKELVEKGPIVQIHDPEKENIIKTDASGDALGLVLEQPDDTGKLRPVAFHSRKLTNAERNYDTHNRELLAIVEGFRKWRHYLQGAKHQILVQSDHKNLKYFTMTKPLTGRQIRWHEELTKFDFRIEHIEGKRNTAADALSRQPDYAIGVKQPESNLLQQNGDSTIQCNREAVLAAMIIMEDKDFLERLRKATEKDEYLK